MRNACKRPGERRVSSADVDPHAPRAEPRHARTPAPASPAPPDGDARGRARARASRRSGRPRRTSGCGHGWTASAPTISRGRSRGDTSSRRRSCAARCTSSALVTTSRTPGSIGNDASAELQRQLSALGEEADLEAEGERLAALAAERPRVATGAARGARPAEAGYRGPHGPGSSGSRSPRAPG